MPAHLALGTNYQSGEIAYPASGKGFVDVVFGKAFKKSPIVRAEAIMKGNTPKLGTVVKVTRFGFRYHFGGVSSEIDSVHWTATEKE